MDDAGPFVLDSDDIGQQAQGSPAAELCLRFRGLGF